MLAPSAAGVIARLARGFSLGTYIVTGRINPSYLAPILPERVAKVKPHSRQIGVAGAPRPKRRHWACRMYAILMLKVPAHLVGQKEMTLNRPVAGAKDPHAFSNRAKGVPAAHHSTRYTSTPFDRPFMRTGGIPATASSCPSRVRVVTLTRMSAPRGRACRPLYEIGA